MTDPPFEPTKPSGPPRRAPPPGACDTHTHVFGPASHFPLQHRPGFALPLAPADVHRRMLDAVGLSRGVLVQPAHYGFDHGCLLDALREGGGRLRGVALADATVSDETLDALHAAGVRGLRFTEVRGPDGAARPGSVGVDQLFVLAGRLRERGWQAHLWAPPQVLDSLLPRLPTLQLPVVVDHMGMVETQAGVEAASFQRLLGHVADGAVWVKLSVCRVAGGDYAEARPFHEALVAANPERLLWGSDWPFIRLGEAAPDVGALLDLFADWTPDATARRTILADNPAALFGFDGR